jgi:hypothetical protein
MSSVGVGTKRARILVGTNGAIVAARMRDIQDLWRDYPASDIDHIVVWTLCRKLT